MLLLRRVWWIFLEDLQYLFSASSAEFVGEIDSESPRSGVSLLKVVHNRPIREWV
jgi:hypothetical protein